METWIMFWKYLLIAGIGAFVISVLLIVPLGARDVISLFRELGKRDK